jgi:hypothetical protein
MQKTYYKIAMIIDFLNYIRYDNSIIYTSEEIIKKMRELCEIIKNINENKNSENSPIFKIGRLDIVTKYFNPFSERFLEKKEIPTMIYKYFKSELNDVIINVHVPNCDDHIYNIDKSRDDRTLFYLYDELEITHYYSIIFSRDNFLDLSDHYGNKIYLDSYYLYHDELCYVTNKIKKCAVENNNMSNIRIIKKISIETIKSVIERKQL